MVVRMKSLRLALFNIKKHRSESISMMILVTICMILLGSGASNLIDIQRIYGNLVEQNHAVKNNIEVSDSAYHEFYDAVFQNDDRVERFVHVEGTVTNASKFIDKEGKEVSQYMFFLTQEEEEKMEDFHVVTELSEEEVSKLEHPLYVPFYVKESLGFCEGDTFNLILNGKIYPFTVAGFFESTIFSDNMLYLKMVLSDADFRTIRVVTDKGHILGFDAADNNLAAAIYEDFMTTVEENTSNGEIMTFVPLLHKNMEKENGQFVKLILKLMMLMSALILVSVLLMISYKIADDISEQVVAIGVLEALGYKSIDISLSYVFEYLLLGTAGATLGIVGSLIISPSIFKIGEVMTGHHGQSSPHMLLQIGFALLLLLFIVTIAILRSRLVKKYPPVVAFRKGIVDHSYAKNVLPLEGTKCNVHLRLAMKGFLGNVTSYIGVGICIAISTCTIVLCFMFYDYFREGSNALRTMTGMEIPDARVVVTYGTDIYKMREELLEDERVDRIALSADWFTTHVQYEDQSMSPIVYKDYSKVKNIYPLNGRIPKHDNEVMITGLFMEQNGLNVGDTMDIKLGRIEKEYMICGVVAGMSNAGANIYMTEDAFKRIKPSYQPNVLEISLKEGVDYKEYSSWIQHSYGRSISDAMEDDCSGDSRKERITKEAEKRMAKLLAMYDISHVEYAIMIDGEEIKGSSSIFKIESCISLKEILETQTGGAIKAFKNGSGMFMLISVMVIMIIMFMIMTSNVKKMRHELGIYKGLGYTSRELMLQLSLRIVPTLMIGVGLGTALGVAGINLTYNILGKLEYRPLAILLVDLLIILFAFVSAYLGAGKIRKISVCELVSE